MASYHLAGPRSTEFLVILLTTGEAESCAATEALSQYNLSSRVHDRLGATLDKFIFGIIIRRSLV